MEADPDVATEYMGCKASGPYARVYHAVEYAAAIAAGMGGRATTVCGREIKIWNPVTESWNWARFPSDDRCQSCHRRTD